MEVDVYTLLEENPILLTFVVIGFGYLMGNMKIAGIQVGSTIGVLIAGLIGGHLGFPDQPAAAQFGFTVFIFCVGLQAGPRFFSAFLEDGPKYIALAVMVALTGVSLALVLSYVFGFAQGLNAGLLAGALTSTPTLAGAQDALKSGLATLPEGVTARQAMSNVRVGYAITYIFGTVGLIVFFRYFPKFIGVDLPGEARRFAQQRGLLEGTKRRDEQADTLPIIRAYRVRGESVGKTIEQLLVETGRRYMLLKIRRGNQFFEPDPDLKIEANDEFSVIASSKDHKEAREQGLDEVIDPQLLNYEVSSRHIVVINPQAVGRPLKELGITSKYGCFVTGVTRVGIELPADNTLLVNKGDRLHVAGEQGRLHKLAESIGHIEEEVEETDLLTFSFGIVGGVLSGLVLVKIGDLHIGLGSAGGLLLAGILIGFLSSVHPTFGRVPGPARYILMELSLMLFMTSIGLKAGAGFVQALTSVGPTIIMSGILVTLTPVVVGYAFGHYVLKLNPALLLGSITGAMTSTAALGIVNDAAKSAVPSLGYAGTYTFANVLLMFAGTLIVLL